MSLYRDYSDVELTKSLRNGERGAFAEIYNRFAALLHRYSLSILDDTDKAQDIVHDILLMLWESRDKLEIHTSLSAYLYTCKKVATKKKITRYARISHFFKFTSQ